MPRHFYYLLLRKRFMKFVTSRKLSFVWGGRGLVRRFVKEGERGRTGRAGAALANFGV